MITKGYYVVAYRKSNWKDGDIQTYYTIAKRKKYGTKRDAILASIAKYMYILQKYLLTNTLPTSVGGNGCPLCLKHYYADDEENPCLKCPVFHIAKGNNHCVYTPWEPLNRILAAINNEELDVSELRSDVTEAIINEIAFLEKVLLTTNKGPWLGTPQELIDLYIVEG